MRSWLFLLFCITIAGNTFAQNEDISGGLYFESEPYMVLDPLNPQHIVVAWMGTMPTVHTSIKTIVSYNSGATWSSPVALPHQAGTYTSADVSMAYDHNDNLFICYIDHSENNDSGGVYVAMSADGGLTWGVANKVIDGMADNPKAPLDRPWLAIGKTSGSIPDTLYVTTKPAPWVPAPNRPYFMMSADSGLTWTPWRYLDTAGYLAGNFIQAPMTAPATDSSGRWRGIYPSYVPSLSVYPRYIMASHIYSNSFTYNIASTIIGAHPNDTLAKLGYRFICDPGNNNHYALFTVTNYYGDMDIFCTQTRDGGATWSAEQRVNDDTIGNGKLQDLVWANFDEHHNIIAAWRDRRNAPDSGYAEPSEIWGAVQWADSANFSANFRISDTAAPYDSIYLATPGDDFMNVAMAQDTMSAVWADDRTGALNVWFSRRDMATGTTIIKNIVHEALPVVNIYPLPVKNSLNVDGIDVVAIAVYDISGKKVLDQKCHSGINMVDMSRLTPGVYNISVATLQGIVNKKLVKE